MVLVHLKSIIYDQRQQEIHQKYTSPVNMQFERKRRRPAYRRVLVVVVIVVMKEA